MDIKKFSFKGFTVIRCVQVRLKTGRRSPVFFFVGKNFPDRSQEFVFPFKTGFLFSLFIFSFFAFPGFPLCPELH